MNDGLFEDYGEAGCVSGGCPWLDGADAWGFYGILIVGGVGIWTRRFIRLANC